METIRFKEASDEELRNETPRDAEVQAIREALEKGDKEMKGVALGLFQ